MIDILKPRDRPVIIPSADLARNGEEWRCPYRPSLSDPNIGGDVREASMKYRIVAGDEVEALQLDCSQTLGNYYGYSGGPVERNRDENRAILGAVLEQYPDRQEPERASGVLFATTIREVLRRFDSLGVSHLINVLCQSPGSVEVPGPGRPSNRTLESRISNANALLEAIREWGRRGLLDPTQVSDCSLRVVEDLIDDAEAG
ncbi:MAG: hypothetical protein WBP71_05195 [Terracidiphilus sp.]